jgi:hypothetical protein
MCVDEDPMQNSELARLLASIAASDPIEREKAADEITDIGRSLGQSEVELIVRELIATRIRESVYACQEAQLNALNDLKIWHKISRRAFADLLPLQGEDLGPQSEYLDELLMGDE